MDFNPKIFFSFFAVLLLMGFGMYKVAFNPITTPTRYASEEEKAAAVEGSVEGRRLPTDDSQSIAEIEAKYGVVITREPTEIIYKQSSANLECQFVSTNQQHLMITKHIGTGSYSIYIAGREFACHVVEAVATQ